MVFVSNITMNAIKLLYTSLALIFRSYSVRTGSVLLLHFMGQWFSNVKFKYFHRGFKKKMCWYQCYLWISHKCPHNVLWPGGCTCFLQQLECLVYAVFRPILVGVLHNFINLYSRKRFIFNANDFYMMLINCR